VIIRVSVAPFHTAVRFEPVDIVSWTSRFIRPPNLFTFTSIIPINEIYVEFSLIGLRDLNTMFYIT